ncbi:protein-disulfide reductase DsbD [Hydrogenimonas cancrithermarum]|uniref:Thiol:disulfide interchange protein DsbD n=1 Tax=Hydrogenimonas cancrithermarum TaxID=2993563 RepID=A0ABM8FLA6_9BACT|nr:protein-disulfide reductase DsbD [Hydrogenimonas cancrithermarum]BDY12230.1 thiol:disulfide interchange protein [Hydrogenimonas cancrithermarum]
MKKSIVLLFFALSLFAEFLSVDEAFKPSVTMKEDAFHVKIEIADHIHLTKNALKFSVEPSNKAALGSYTLPPSEKDEFGDEVYAKQFEVTIPLVLKDPKSKEVTFILEYQGCSDRGVCYPPVTKRYPFSLQTVASAQSNATSDIQHSTSNEGGGLSEEESIASTLKTKSFGIVLFTFFGFGLLLALTPCVFPMIPILSSIIVAQGEGMTAKRGFALSLIYVLSMALTYTIAGVLAGLFGANIQAALQNPWVISIFALLFVALAFSMFGFYELQLPATIQSKLSRTSDEAGKKGGLAGVAVMGFLSALIVGPCVAPPLAGALIYIGQTGDALLGGAALFVMSLGMGLPLLLIGTGAGKFMPKPGGWMMAVSKVFGVVMLGVAIWMLSRILPDTIVMGLWAALFIVSAIYMGALEPLGEKRSWNALFKGLGFLMLVYGLFLLFGTFTGASSPIDPLKVVKERSSGTSVSERSLPFQPVSSLDDLLAKIESGDKPVMVDFRADWCVSCKELEESTFKDPRVIGALRGYNLYQVDVTQNSPEQKKLMKHFGVFGPPAILFFEKGEEIKSKRISGYKSPDEFVAIVEGKKG